MNKIALVTGASRGIGKAIAEHLVKAGITVVGTATSNNGAQNITDNLKAINNAGKSIGLMLNIADANSVISLIQLIEKSFGSLPVILINNAGITKDNLFLRMKEEEWVKVIDANLSGVFRLTKACIKFMLKEHWGRIINISSVIAFSGNAGQANYAAAKAGIIGFTKSLAQEVATRGVTVNAIAPGFIETDMTKSLPENIKNQILERIPMKRFGSAEEIAKAVMFLTSNDASYITGNTIHINGGMLMN